MRATRSRDPLAASLRAIVGDDQVLIDPAITAPYEIDWTRRFSGRARLVVRPADTTQAAAVLRACHASSVPVVPQGGNTGLVGGGVPRGGEVVLSLRRLTRLDPIDTVADQVTVGAGVTLGALQSHVGAAGLAFGVDLAARDSATVGGMIATNAGGIHVVRYGPMRAQIVGIEAVSADGRLFGHLGSVAKEVAGYDFRALLAGSEGTLGVVTAACLRLVPQLPHRAVAFIGVESPTAAVLLATQVRRGLDELQAIEFLDEASLELVLQHRGHTRPLRARFPAYLLVEAGGHRDRVDEVVRAIVDAGADGDAVVLASDASGLARLWALREAVTESISAEGIPHKLDVAVPLSKVAHFIDEVPRRVRRVDQGAATAVFGHLAEGNLHVNVVGPAIDDPRTDAAVLRLTLALGGSISAEHGIGVAKAAWLRRARGEGDVRLLRAIKRALDPDGILNPGVLFTPE